MPLQIKGATPKHIGIIMDGNRRWAKKRMLPSALGHAAGAKKVRAIVEACAKAGVEHLSIFAFSTENWRRPEALSFYVPKLETEEEAKYIHLMVETAEKLLQKK